MSHDHFARPATFGDQEVDTCIDCGDPIVLYSNPDGRRIWRHTSDVLDELEP